MTAVIGQRRRNVCWNCHCLCRK